MACPGAAWASAWFSSATLATSTTLADAVLVADELRRLPYLFDLVQKVMKKVKTNIVASLFINLTAVVLSALGVLTPVTGALWHNFGSVFVVVNAAMLLRNADGEGVR